MIEKILHSKMQKMIDSIKYTKWLDDDPRVRKEKEATLEVINQYRNNRAEIRKLY